MKVSKSSLSGLVAVVVALFVFSTGAMAQVENPSQITVQGTALITKDSTSDNGSIGRQATKSGGFLVGYSYQFNSWAGAEGNYGYTRNTQNYIGSIGQSLVQADMHELTGSFVARIPCHVARVRPYALAGAGGLIFEPNGTFAVSGVE